MKYDKDFETNRMGKRLSRAAFYNAAIDFSLRFMAQSFCIDELKDNKRPRDGEKYITIDKSTDTMTILSLFDKSGAYAVIHNVSTANLNAELLRVYDKEAAYLKERFMHIGHVYMCKDFEDFKIHCDLRDGCGYVLFCILVGVKDLNTGHYFWEKQKFTLEDLAKINNVGTLAHELFASIHSALLRRVNEKDSKLN